MVTEKKKEAVQHNWDIFRLRGIIKTLNNLYLRYDIHDLDEAYVKCKLALREMKK